MYTHDPLPSLAPGCGDTYWQGDKGNSVIETQALGHPERVWGTHWQGGKAHSPYQYLGAGLPGDGEHWNREDKQHRELCP